MKLEMPPGIYYIGDPCYRAFSFVFQTEGEWNDYDPDVKIPLMVESSYCPTFLVWTGTCYGDGTYQCTLTGNDYPVDSGCLSVVKMVGTVEELSEATSCDYGTFVVVKERWVLEMDVHHTFKGTLESGETFFSIPTGSDGDEDDEMIGYFFEDGDDDE